MTLADRTTVYPGRAQWLAARGLGGSDMAAVLGASPHKSAYTCAAEKAGLIEPEDIGDLWHIRRGNYLEPAVLAMWQDETGMVADRTQFTIITDEEFPFITVTPDALLPDVAESGEGVEIKTTSFFAKADWEEGVPLYAQIQMQACMRVTGASEWHYAALFSMNDPPVIGVLERHDRFIEGMVAEAVRFWNEHVLPRRPPAPDGTEGTSRSIARLFPKVKGEGIELSDEILPEHTGLLGVRTDLKAARKQVRALETEERAYKNTIRAAMGEAAYGKLPHGAGYYIRTPVHKKGGYRKAQRYSLLNWRETL